MSQENVEIVRRSIDAFGRADLEGVVHDFDPEFEFHPSGRFMDAQRVYRGRQGWAEFWATFRAAWEGVADNIERIEDLDNRVLTLGDIRASGVGSGVEVQVQAGWLHTIRDGRIVHRRAFATWAEALEAAGLRE